MEERCFMSCCLMRGKGGLRSGEGFQRKRRALRKSPPILKSPAPEPGTVGLFRAIIGTGAPLPLMRRIRATLARRTPPTSFPAAPDGAGTAFPPDGDIWVSPGPFSAWGAYSSPLQLHARLTTVATAKPPMYAPRRAAAAQRGAVREKTTTPRRKQLRGVGCVGIVAGPAD